MPEQRQAVCSHLHLLEAEKDHRLRDAGDLRSPRAVIGGVDEFQQLVGQGLVRQDHIDEFLSRGFRLATRQAIDLGKRVRDRRKVFLALHAPQQKFDRAMRSILLLSAGREAALGEEQLERLFHGRAIGVTAVLVRLECTGEEPRKSLPMRHVT